MKLVRRCRRRCRGCARGPPTRTAEGLPRVGLLLRRRSRTQLVRRAVERRSAERIVRLHVVGVLAAAAAAEREISAPATRPAASARAHPDRRARHGPPKALPPVRQNRLAARPEALPNSPVAGSNSPRPMASRRSFIMPRSRLAMLPLIATASVGPSVENPAAAAGARRRLPSRSNRRPRRPPPASARSGFRSAGRRRRWPSACERPLALARHGRLAQAQQVSCRRRRSGGRR